MVLSEAIQDYGDYIRHELGHATTTFYSYRSWQRNFARWLAENGMPDPLVREVGVSLIRRYAYHLSGRGLRPRTVRGALHALRALFGYLTERGALAANPAAEVRLPKKDAATRRLVTDDDLVRLLEAAERQRSEFRSVRDRAVLAVFIYCGLRRQELLDLRLTALNLADQSLLVQQGKGKRSRTIYLCDEAQQALREWLAVRQTLRCPNDYLFVTEGRRHFAEQSLATMLEEVKAIAGLKGDPAIKPHSIRHAAATRLLRNGADLRSIQVWLGHTQLQTTSIYLHTDEQQVRKIAPLAGLQPRAPESPLTGSEPNRPVGRSEYLLRRRRSRP
jgi:site-specific recombinase XerD